MINMSIYPLDKTEHTFYNIIRPTYRVGQQIKNAHQLHRKPQPPIVKG